MGPVYAEFRPSQRNKTYSEVMLGPCAGGSGCADPPTGGQNEGGACWPAQHQEHDDDDASHLIPGASVLQAAVAGTPRQVCPSGRQITCATDGKQHL